jgi:hypothetical protein
MFRMTRPSIGPGSIFSMVGVRFLFNSARNGNVSAQIFWLKTRARWKETPTQHQHTGAFGTIDVQQLSDDQLAQMIAGIEAPLPPDVRAARHKALAPALQAAVVTSTICDDHGTG